MKTNGIRSSVFVLVVVLLFLAAGFYLVLSEIGDLKEDLGNLELALSLSKKEEVIGEAVGEAPLGESPLLPDEKITVVPTAIIFNTRSSSVLSPQTNVTVTVEGVGKSDDGTIFINIKVFTNEATAYSALLPRDLFELINLKAGAQAERPVKVEGSFDSIPPKSAASGRVIFKTDGAEDSVILQIRYDNNLRHYEIDFSKRNYKEAILG